MVVYLLELCGVSLGLRSKELRASSFQLGLASVPAQGVHTHRTPPSQGVAILNVLMQVVNTLTPAHHYNQTSLWFVKDPESEPKLSIPPKHAK